MKIAHYTDVEESPVEEGAEGVTVRWVIAEDDGAKNFAMRVFEVQPGGHTPQHAHPWEHEVYVLSGKGIVRVTDGDHDLREGDVVFVPENEEHQFRNPGPDVVRFLCMVPRHSYAPQ